MGGARDLAIGASTSDSFNLPLLYLMVRTFDNPQVGPDAIRVYIEPPASTDVVHGRHQTVHSLSWSRSVRRAAAGGLQVPPLREGCGDLHERAVSGVLPLRGHGHQGQAPQLLRLVQVRRQVHSRDRGTEGEEIVSHWIMRKGSQRFRVEGECSPGCEADPLVHPHRPALVLHLCVEGHLLDTHIPQKLQ